MCLYDYVYRLDSKRRWNFIANNGKIEKTAYTVIIRKNMIQSGNCMYYIRLICLSHKENTKAFSFLVSFRKDELTVYNNKNIL